MMKQDIPSASLTIAGIPLKDFSVVCRFDALPGVLNAAGALSELAARAFGVTLPLVKDSETDASVSPHEIVIGETNRDTDAVRRIRSTVRDDGYALICDGGRLYITGAIDRGSVYGVYAFAEKWFGVLFLNDTCTHCHPTGSRNIPETYLNVSNPGFMMRDSFWCNAIQPRQTEDTGHMVFPYALRNNDGEFPDVGGGVYYVGGRVHTLPLLAEMTNCQPGEQPCLTDETVFQTVRKNVRKLLSENPEAKIISVSQNDSYAHQKGCQCPRCREIDEREGTPMGSLLTFVNRIADDIREDYPDVLVDTLAYRYTRKPPKNIVPADNVIIRLCSIECCFAHPIDDPNCEKNVSFCQDIEGWAKISRHLSVWDYTTNFLYYLSPFPNLGVLRDNVRFFYRNHVIGLFEQGNYQSQSGEFGELRAYLLSRLLWNPHISEGDYEAMTDEFLSEYYGNGWRYIREYIDTTGRIAADGHIGIYDHPLHMLPPDTKIPGFDGDLCTYMLSLFEKAEENAGSDEARAHVEQSKIQVLYYTLMADEPTYGGHFDHLYDLLRHYGIAQFREGSAIPSTNSRDLLS